MLEGRVIDLLMEAQYNFPLVDRPFLELANRIGASEGWVIDTLRALVKAGVVRRIGALVNYRARGMESALVALRVPEALVDEVAAYINRDRQVTHNFLRAGSLYNIWYVTKAPTRAEVESKVLDVVNRFKISDYVILYSERTFKIDVKFDLYRGVSRAKRLILPENVPDVKALNIPQGFLDMVKSIGIVEEPFREIASRLNMAASKVIETIVRLREVGVLRDFYATLDPDAVGFRSNAMVNMANVDCLKVAEVDEATHVVKRTPVPGRWRYDCYFMIHGRSDELVNSTIADIARRLNVRDYVALFSVRNLLSDMARRLEQ